MGLRSQRGSALVETAVAVAILAVVAGAALNATIFAARSAGIHPERAALQAALQREMPVALDVIKYRGGAIAPATIATTVPMPTGSPLAADLSIAVSPAPDGSVRVGLAAASADDPREHAELFVTLGAQAPLPGSILQAPGLAPAPTGAP